MESGQDRPNATSVGSDQGSSAKNPVEKELSSSSAPKPDTQSEIIKNQKEYESMGDSTGLDPTDKEKSDKKPESTLGEDNPKRLYECVHKYEPLIPAPVVKYHLERAGCEMADEELVRVVGLAAQKLVGDIVSDTRRRLYGRTLAKRKRTKEDDDGKKTLQTVDLAPSLIDQGVSIQKPDFYLYTDDVEQ